MSLRRAVAVIQAPGLSGTPSACQLTTAAANASCIASSARSKECETRMRPAIMRPDSLRKTASTVARWSCIHGYALRKFADWADFDASCPTGTSSGNFGSPGKCFVEILTVEYVVSSQLFLGFGKWTVSDYRRAILQANCSSGRAGFERVGSTEDAASERLLHDSLVSPGDRAHVFGRRCLIFLRVNQHHVTHDGLSVWLE